MRAQVYTPGQLQSARSNLKMQVLLARLLVKKPYQEKAYKIKRRGSIKNTAEVSNIVRRMKYYAFEFSMLTAA